MTLAWPIAPRSAVRDRVEAALQRRPFPSVLLWGATGIGKTTIADLVGADVARRGGRVVHVVALEELAEVPFGAFSTVLATLGDGQSSATDRLTNIVGAIARLSPDLVVIDDAPLLDPLSATAVYQLARLHKLPCLLTARDEHALTGPVQRLEHEGVLERVVVGPLTEPEVEAVLERRLGEHVHAESVRGIHERSAGNPLVLRAIALAAEEQRLIRPGRGGLVVQEPSLPRHVGAVMSQRLAGLDAGARSAAAVLALAQPLPRELAPPEVRELERSATASLDESGALTLFHPLAAHVLIEELGDERSAVAERAAALLASSEDEHVRFRSVLVRVRHGLDAPAADLARAAALAHAVQDHALAVRLARLALEPEPERFDALLPLGSAQSALGDAEAEEVLRRAADVAATDDQRALAVARLGQHLALREGRPGEAVAVATRALEAIADSGASALVGAELVKWRAMDGEALPDGVDASGADGPARLGALVTEAMIGSMTANAPATRAATAEARPLAATFRPVVPFADDLLDLNDFLALVIRGELRDAERFARGRHERPSGDATGLWSYTLALLALHTGRAALALELATRAARELEWRDFTGVRGAALALRATAEAQNGEDPEPTLSALDESAFSDVKVRLQAAEARAWSRLLNRDPDAAARTAADALADGSAAHHLTLAALASMVAIRAGHGVLVAEPLAQLAAATGSELVGVLADWASAARPDELAAAARALDEIGLVAPAVETWERAADLARTTEDARRWRREAQRCAGDTELLLLTAPPVAVELTARERAVAELAADRLRSAEIAADLGVSVRTVDNTLARVYRKLGVTSRLELPAALARLEGADPR